MNYSCAFAVDNFNNILLIEKNKPKWQAGFLNGVGGKVEFGETTREAMTREFQEETGIYVSKNDWIYVCELFNSIYENSKVAFFIVKLPEIKFENKTDEKLVLVPYEDLGKFILMPNLKALIELSLLRLNHHGTIYCSGITF